MILGVTGGAGSGKTTVISFLEQQGWNTIDVDSIAKSIIDENMVVHDQIKDLFGMEYFDENDKLNRRKLGQRVFSNLQDLNQLTQLVWPEMISTLKTSIEEIKNISSKPIAVDMAILFEANCQDLFDYILVVIAPLYKRIDRLTLQRKWTKKETEQRIRNQINEEIKIDKADYIIENNGDLEILKDKTLSLIQWLNEQKNK